LHFVLAYAPNSTFDKRYVGAMTFMDLEDASGIACLSRGEPLKVLLIEDNEDDYVLIREMLRNAYPCGFHLDWIDTYDAAIEAVCRLSHDVYLLDYRLGERDGIQLLQEAISKGCTAPIIFLTGLEAYEVHIEAMHWGAADYLVKAHMTGPLLERAIRYALERARNRDRLIQSELELRKLSAQLLTVQERERKRLAQELHDGIGQSLAAIKYGVEQTRVEMGDRLKPVTRSRLDTVVALAQQVIEEARRIQNDLRPPILDDLGIIATLSWFAREIEKVYSRIRIQSKFDIRETDLREDLKIVIYRIVQEALHNAAKHSQAELIRINLKKEGKRVVLTVSDNGIGMDRDWAPAADDGKTGLGLASMRERTKLSGGKFRLESRKGRGTTIRAIWEDNGTSGSMRKDVHHD
jgi:signal transduction histidine kinase